MTTVGTYHAKTHLTDLLNRVEAGETITITRHGRPVAKIVPADAPGRAVDDAIAMEFRRLRESVAARGGAKGSSVRDLVREGRRL